MNKKALPMHDLFYMVFINTTSKTIAYTNRKCVESNTPYSDQAMLTKVLSQERIDEREGMRLISGDSSLQGSDRTIEEVLIFLHEYYEKYYTNTPINHLVHKDIFEEYKAKLNESGYSFYEI